MIARLVCVLSLLCAVPVVAQNESDPLEGFNRAMFSFNEGADKVVLKPLAKGYRAVTPDPVEKGFSNVFSNLLEVRNVANDILQWKWGQAVNDTGRFLVNSTIGVVGLFDVADGMGLEKSQGEDFGQTLGAWGVGSGAYIVLPLLGPSTVRDGSMMPLNSLAHPVSHIDHVPTRNSARGTEIIINRAALLDAEKMISGDRYSFIRDAYLQRRQFLVNDGEVEDNFGDDLDQIDF